MSLKQWRVLASIYKELLKHYAYLSIAVCDMNSKAQGYSVCYDAHGRAKELLDKLFGGLCALEVQLRALDIEEASHEH